MRKATTYAMTGDVYVNIFLSRNFKERRSAYGLKFFEHKKTGVFITYDPKGIQTRIINNEWSRKFRRSTKYR